MEEMGNRRSIGTLRLVSPAPVILYLGSGDGGQR
jgi:hypothetical protein